jgi:hypothetical protein
MLVFMKIVKMYSKVKYCQVNKESDIDTSKNNIAALVMQKMVINTAKSVINST